MSTLRLRAKIWLKIVLGNNIQPHSDIYICIYIYIYQLHYYHTCRWYIILYPNWWWWQPHGYNAWAGLKMILAKEKQRGARTFRPAILQQGVDWMRGNQGTKWRFECDLFICKWVIFQQAHVNPTLNNQDISGYLRQYELSNPRTCRRQNQTLCKVQNGLELVRRWDRLSMSQLKWCKWCPAG